MDPTNNPTPTPNPAPTPGPAPAAPEAPAAPGAPVPPTAPETPAAPTASPNPTPATAAGGMTAQPVNPIIAPTAPNPVGSATAPAPVGNPTAQPEGLAATDPIMMPEPAPAPDPVEEELKAPMKAAAPAPGSIGSAVSGPAATEPAPEASAPADNPFISSDKPTPSVAFNDPATQPDAAANPVTPAKKKTNKTTLIALIIVAVMIVIALAGVLIFQLIGEQTPPSPSPSPNNPVTIEEDSDSDTSDADSTASTTTTAASTLSCVRNMTAAEIARANDAASGTISISAEFDDENLLSKVTLTEMVTYSDEDAVSNEPVENGVHEALAENLTPESAAIYFLPTDSTGALDLTKKSIQANYESLDFVCEVL